MSATALLVEELVEVTGLSRQVVRDAINSIHEAVDDSASALRLRVSAIMSRSASLQERFDEVVTVTDDNFDMHAKARIAAALGLGVLGGMVLAGATTLLATLAGIVLIASAGFMIRDLLRLAMNQLKEKLDSFSIW